MTHVDSVDNQTMMYCWNYPTLTLFVAMVTACCLCHRCQHVCEAQVDPAVLCSGDVCTRGVLFSQHTHVQTRQL